MADEVPREFVEVIPRRIPNPLHVDNRGKPTSKDIEPRESIWDALNRRAEEVGMRMAEDLEKRILESFMESK